MEVTLGSSFDLQLTVQFFFKGQRVRRKPEGIISRQETHLLVMYKTIKGSKFGF